MSACNSQLQPLFKSALLGCLQNTLHSVLVHFTSSVCAGIPALTDNTINSQVSYRNERWRNDQLSLLKNHISYVTITMYLIEMGIVLLSRGSCLSFHCLKINSV